MTHLDGQLVVALGENFGAPTVLQMLLRTPSAHVVLRAPAAPRAQVLALAGRRVHVTGRRVSFGRGFGLDVVSLAPESTGSAGATNSPSTVRRAIRVAVVLMHPPGSQREGATAQRARAVFFGATGSVAKWFRDGSGNQVNVSGKVFGYYDSPLRADDCALNHWLAAAMSAAARDGYSPSNYTNLVVYTPRRRCPFSHIARIGLNGVYIQGRLDQGTVEHGLGHNLGLLSAGAYSCSPPAPSCLHDNGDPVDVMGRAYTNRQFSAVHKYMLGWIPPSEVQTVSNGTHTIALTASVHPVVAGSTELVLVPRSDGTQYAIERRESPGNTGDAGVWVRVVARAGTDDTELPVKHALAPGDSFVDAADEITITTLSDSGPTASVRVCVACTSDGTTSTSTSTSVSSSTSSSTTSTLPSTGGSGGDGVGIAASREIMWTSCSSIAWLSDAQLDEWQARGIGGFVCEIGHMASIGGDQEFSADPNAPLTGPRHDLQRQIRDSHIVARAAARGIKLWVGIYLSNYYQRATPLDEWFDDSAWSTQLLPKLGDVAGAARMLGFAGLALDEEQYDGGSWKWNYRGNTHSEAEVRAEVRARGAQMMSTIVNAFPGVDLLDYGTYFPEGWNELVQQQINHAQNAYAPFVQINLWDGLTSVPGYGPIRFMDATFYKSAHLWRASWDTALSYNVNRLMAYLSRHLANWSYASTRVGVSPLAWIDGDVQNEGPWTAPRDPAFVAEQLSAFRRWGMGGAFSIFSYAPLGRFDYTPYAAAMQAASVAGTVDSESPGITINSVQRTDGGVVVSGTATDNMAISSVGWQAGPTGDGTAPMTWTVTSGDWATGYEWHMDWTATIPASPGEVITFTAQDSTGHTTNATATAP